MKRVFAVISLLVTVPGCSDAKAGDDTGCTPDDQDGVVGDKTTVILNVSDDAFAVGSADSTERNITIQNSTVVTLTLMNVGTKPHSFVVECIPTDLPPGCPQKSCFPKAADIPPVDPAESATVKFKAPLVEGAYPFSSDVAGDDDLMGQFVLN